jgi:hypothetical protein
MNNPCACSVDDGRSRHLEEQASGLISDVGDRNIVVPFTNPIYTRLLEKEDEELSDSL